MKSYLAMMALLAMMASCSTLKKNMDSNYKAKSEKRFQERQQKEEKKAGTLETQKR